MREGALQQLMKVDDFFERGGAAKQIVQVVISLNWTHCFQIISHFSFSPVLLCLLNLFTVESVTHRMTFNEMSLFCMAVLNGMMSLLPCVTSWGTIYAWGETIITAFVPAHTNTCSPFVLVGVEGFLDGMLSICNSEDAATQLSSNWRTDTCSSSLTLHHLAPSSQIFLSPVWPSSPSAWPRSGRHAPQWSWCVGVKGWELVVLTFTSTYCYSLTRIFLDKGQNLFAEIMFSAVYGVQCWK